jgi:CBS domain-containing protein
MKVRDLMTRDVRTCQADDDLAVAGRTMAHAGCGALPVRGPGGEVVGFLTDRDLCAYVCEKDRRPSEMKVAEVMHREVWACAPDHDVEEALAIMRRHHVRRLPVLDDANRIVGLVSIDDVVMLSRPVVSAHDGPADTEVARTLRSASHVMPHSLAPR